MAHSREKQPEEEKSEDSVTEEVKPKEVKPKENSTDKEARQDVSKETVVTAEAAPYVVSIPVGVRKKIPVWAKICMITVLVAARSLFS